MNPRLSIVVPYRNRNLGRVRALWGSLKATTSVPFEFIVSDYGSLNPFATDLRSLAQAEGFRVVRSEAAGLPWSRARAINTGVRQALAETVVILDVDMVLHGPALDHVASNLADNEALFLESLWPQGPKKDPFRGRLHRSHGVFMAVQARWFHELHGFCEDLKFWGGEDNDWVRRLVQAGVKPRWLTTDQFKLVHTWHPQENNPVTRPYTAVADTLRIEMRNLVAGYRNPDWGRAILREERPVLDRLDESSPWTVSGEAGPLMDRVAEIAAVVAQGRLVRIDLGPRVPPRKLTGASSLLLRFREGFELFSLTLGYQVSGRLEEVLTLADLLGDQADLYLDDATGRAFLTSRTVPAGGSQ